MLADSGRGYDLLYVIPEKYMHFIVVLSVRSQRRQGRSCRMHTAHVPGNSMCWIQFGVVLGSARQSVSGGGVQDAAVESRPQSAAEGIAELQRILCSSAADAAAQADSGEWVFDHTLLEAAVTVRFPNLHCNISELESMQHLCGLHCTD